MLIAILLPALHGARESSQSVQCASNIRSLWQATSAYAADFDGALPFGPGATDTWRANAPAQLAYFLTTAANPKMIDLLHPGAVSKNLAGQTAARQTLRCPIAQDGTANFSYTFHPDLNTTKGAGRLSRVVNPPQKILIFEQDNPTSGQFAGPSGGDHDADDTPAPGVPSIHHYRVRSLGRGNYGFADGHIESRTPDEVNAQLKLYPHPFK